MGAAATEELRALEQRGEHAALIDALREQVAADRRILADPWVKEWCGRRWRSLFVAEAARDPDAVSVASARYSIPGTDLSVRRSRDERPERRRIAERFLHEPTDADWDEDTLPPRHEGVREATLIFCPGLIGSMLPERAFRQPFATVAAEHGWRIVCAEAHPMRGCDENVDDLVAAIERGLGLDHECAPIQPGQEQAPGDVFLLCYSKGAPDALTLLAHRPELAERIKAVFCWAGAIGGSYLADDMHASLERINLPLGTVSEHLKTLLRTIFPVIRLDDASVRLDEFDVKAAVRDLTTPVRAEFLSRHGEAIDALGIPIFTISGATTPLEVPYFQAQGAMELGRYDPHNDMQVIQEHARMAIPMSTHLATLHAHHWDMSYDPFPIQARLGSANLDHPFPRRAALTAIFDLTAELGLIR
jgi:hypothetical protein